ncbi:hypothetical protein J6590_007322 [Homalodisca vitripennis]|nr:hypothetical protein J6590_007322 [Homalodisca vitripennis]
MIDYSTILIKNQNLKRRQEVVGIIPKYQIDFYFDQVLNDLYAEKVPDLAQSRRQPLSSSMLQNHYPIRQSKESPH